MFALASKPSSLQATNLVKPRLCSPRLGVYAVPLAFPKSGGANRAARVKLSGISEKLSATASRLLPAFGAVTASLLANPQVSLAFNNAAAQSEANSGHSFITTIGIALCTYWFIQALLPRQDTPTDTKSKSDRESSGGDSDGLPHVHIRSFSDPYQQREVDWASWRALENRVLAKSAAFEVATMLKESQPRVRTFLQQPGQFLLQRPHICDVDPVAEIVYKYLTQLKQLGKAPLASGQTHLDDDSVTALQRDLLVAVAEWSAMEQINHMVSLAQNTTSRPTSSPAGQIQRQHGST